MKIEGPRQTGAAGAPRKGGSAAAPGFSVPAGAAGAAAPTRESSPAAALDALMALQADDYDPRRKGRQVKRGKDTLAALDALMRAALLGETVHAPRLMLIKLQSEIEPTGDPKLDSILAEIDQRAAVELAKLEMADRRRA